MLMPSRCMYCEEVLKLRNVSTSPKKRVKTGFGNGRQSDLKVDARIQSEGFPEKRPNDDSGELLTLWPSQDSARKKRGRPPKKLKTQEAQPVSESEVVATKGSQTTQLSVGRARARARAPRKPMSSQYFYF
eukprot:1728183-Amphidinium_carterae.1